MDDDERPWWTRPPDPPAGAATTRRPDPVLDDDEDDDEYDDPFIPHVPGRDPARAPLGQPPIIVDHPPGPAIDLRDGDAQGSPAVPPPPWADVTQQLPAVPPLPPMTPVPPLRVIDPHQLDGSALAAPPGHPPAMPGTPLDLTTAPAPGGPPSPDDGAAARRSSLRLPERMPSAAQLLAAARRPENRGLVVTLAGVVVLMLLGVIALLSRGDEPPAAKPAPKPSAPAVALVGGEAPDGLAKVGTAQAKADLRAAGESDAGTLVSAWGWTDDNGDNLVAALSTAAAGDNVTLRVVHVAHLEGQVKVLRVMRDPSLPGCDSGRGAAGFTANSLQVRDLNRDGVAEVSIGWSSRCGGATAKSEVRLALISDGDKYIMRGKGVIGRAGSGSFQPDPTAAHWPEGFLTALTTLYRQLYY